MLIKYYCYTIWNLFIQNLSRLIFESGGGGENKRFFFSKNEYKKKFGY